MLRLLRATASMILIPLKCKEEKETPAGFSVKPHRAEVMTLLHNKCLVTKQIPLSQEIQTMQYLTSSEGLRKCDHG